MLQRQSARTTSSVQTATTQDVVQHHVTLGISACRVNQNVAKLARMIDVMRLRQAFRNVLTVVSMVTMEETAKFHVRVTMN